MMGKLGPEGIRKPTYLLSPWSWYISVSISTASESNSRLGESTTPSAYNWWPRARFPNTNCAALVRSKQSTQFVRHIPFCNKILFRQGVSWLFKLQGTVSTRRRWNRTAGGHTPILVLQGVRVRLWSSMEKPCHLYRFLCDVLQVTYDISFLTDIGLWAMF